MLYHMASMYSKRHKAYRDFMNKVHNFLIKVKEADKEKRRQHDLKSDPFGKEKEKSTKIKRSLKYAEEGETTKKLHLRLLRDNEGASQKDVEDSMKIFNFLSRTRWTIEPNQQGGVTWLELFVWYKLHHIEKPTTFFAPKDTLQKQMADFKRLTRNVKQYCLSPEDEWHLQTCYGRSNRLRDAGIDNKHAAIRGFPKVPEKDADRIMEHIQRLRGSLNSKKNREKFQKGNMTTKPKSFSYKRVYQHVDQKEFPKDDWTGKPMHPISMTMEEPLTTLCCPTCHADFPIAKLNVKQGSHFSNLKCKICAEVQTSRLWTCECEMPWIKCRRHVLMKDRAKRTFTPRIVRHLSRDHGHDQPLPKRAAIDVGNSPIHLQSEPGRPIRLTPGSKLAVRFPHLVKDITPTKGGDVGVGS